MLQEILSDSRVVKAQLAGRGGRVRDPEETEKAKSLTVTSDGRKEASPSGNGATSIEETGTKQEEVWINVLK